jgi:hypothetical protein
VTDLVPITVTQIMGIQCCQAHQIEVLLCFVELMHRADNTTDVEEDEEECTTRERPAATRQHRCEAFGHDFV